MFKAAIVGCGGIGMTHARSWSSIEDVKVEAVMDLNPEKAQAAAEFCKCRACTSLAELPSDLDGVSVVTPPAAHFPVVKALLERGFNVFCEKPLTMSVAEGRILAEVAAASGKVLAVGFKMRFEPIFIEAKKYLPEIGKLVAITTTKLQAFNPRPEGAWVKSVGAMYELSIHDFDLISFITGRYPQKVLFAHLQHRFGWEKEDTFNIVADYGDGVTAQLQGMYAMSSTFCFRDLAITLLGERGYLRIERPDRIILHADEYKVIEIKGTAKSSFVLELEHFRNCVLGLETNTLT
ncbi:MAG: Gfo/Idh/MocA family protein, partial [Victivallaceae bacterium]